MPVPAEPCLQRVRECRGRASGPASSSTGHHGSKPARWRADGAAHEHEVDAFYVSACQRSEGHPWDGGQAVLRRSMKWVHSTQAHAKGRKGKQDRGHKTQWLRMSVDWAHSKQKHT
eukprot:scaffold143750_cov17-Tisochrysis_lutea.AAC.1